ncbi:hypothetical protein GOP47_0012163 [Adiantum capillus-veneris]|uniref:Uncharacterized protein n=1 Tax=Adiantum capillus-veneris TaxID=13818 RepID=A0A9D4UR74_ADICA|nr:hypothetical protein GOP47_0012163 [Adiantum capillus-veneris]
MKFVPASSGLGRRKGFTMNLASILADEVLEREGLEVRRRIREGVDAPIAISALMGGGRISLTMSWGLLYSGW